MNNDTSSELKARAERLQLWGIVANWDKFSAQPWITTLIEQEEIYRNTRNLERRIKESKLGKFKPFADFDWNWPKEIDRATIDDLFSLSFLAEAANVIIIGQSGAGKTMLAKNLAHHAIVNGASALFVTATQLLNDLASQDAPSSLNRRLRYYARPKLLVIDELGYRATSSQHADLLFEVITRRYEVNSTIVTSDKSFTTWADLFPNASCVVALVDRLIHSSEIINISAESYRLHESTKRQEARRAERTAKYYQKRGL